MIHKILQNPIIKIVGIMIILYFALFANKQEPNSLGNRLKPEVVKKDIKEIKQKSQFILLNLQTTQGAKKETDAPPPKSSEDVVIENLAEGSGAELISCGAETIISYNILDTKNNQLVKVPEQKFIIGNRSNWIIEKNIIGMKSGAIRTISIPTDFKTDDIKLMQLLKSNQYGLKYQVTILSFQNPVNASPDLESHCK